MVEITCKQCKKKFEVQNHRKNSAKFCSIKCRGKFKSKNHLGRKSPKWKESSHIKLICLNCEKEYDSIIQKKDRSNFCSKKCLYEWQSKNIIKEKRYNWKGARPKRKKEGYFNATYRAWRKAVFERDNYTCQFCGAKSGNGKAIYLEAHHIKLWTDFPELRFDINNGITLCKKCHSSKGLHSWEGKRS